MAERQSGSVLHAGLEDLAAAIFFRLCVSRAELVLREAVAAPALGFENAQWTQEEEPSRQMLRQLVLTSSLAPFFFPHPGRVYRGVHSVDAGRRKPLHDCASVDPLHTQKPLVALLLLPYLAWVSLAKALTYSEWQLNPQLLGCGE